MPPLHDGTSPGEATIRRTIGLLLALLALGSLAHAADRKQPIALVGGQPFYEDDLLPFVQGQLLQLRQQEYEIKSKALDSLVNQRLLEAEANRKGIPSEKLFEQEVDSKVPEPTEAELQALYIVQKEQLNRSYEEIKPQLRQLLKQSKIRQARQEYYLRLREQTS